MTFLFIWHITMNPIVQIRNSIKLPVCNKAGLLLLQNNSVPVIDKKRKQL